MARRNGYALRHSFSTGAKLALLPVLVVVLASCTHTVNASDVSESTPRSSSGSSVQSSAAPVRSAKPNSAAGQTAPTPVPVSPITPPITALPSPTCVPTHIDSGAPAAVGWVSTPSGWTVSWTGAEAPYLDEYFSTTTMYPLPGIATMSVSEGGVSKTIAPTIGVWTSSGGRADIWEISPSGGNLAVTKAQLDAAVHSALPSVTTYHVTALSVEVRDIYLTGCGATAISTLTVGGSITTP
jgi:hypothetical protein